jgi:hypothetical protein
MSTAHLLLPSLGSKASQGGLHCCHRCHRAAAAAASLSSSISTPLGSQCLQLQSAARHRARICRALDSQDAVTSRLLPIPLLLPLPMPLLLLPLPLLV